MPQDPRTPPSTTPPGWLIALESCPSTNTWALEHLEALAHGACVWTTRQTAGRGQHGRTWLAPAGVLTASFALELATAVPATRLALAAGLAIAHAVEDLAPGAPLTLKWPNDCLLAGRKLAGVLCERAHAAPGRVVVGIGLNLDPRWAEPPPGLAPASVAEVAPAPDMPAMLAALRRYLLEACGLLAAGGWPRLLPALRARDHLRARALVVQDAGGRHVGTGAGLDDEGRLLIDGPAGRRALASGSVIEIGAVVPGAPAAADR